MVRDLAVCQGGGRVSFVGLRGWGKRGEGEGTFFCHGVWCWFGGGGVEGRGKSWFGSGWCWDVKYAA